MEIDQTAAAEVVTVEVSGAVGVVRLRVPALSRLAKEQLLAGLRRLSGDDAVRAVVLTFDSGLSERTILPTAGRLFLTGRSVTIHGRSRDRDRGGRGAAAARPPRQ